MATLSRRTLLCATSALPLSAVLAACSDTGADGQSVSPSGSGTDGGGHSSDYTTVINSGPVASADAVAASAWASAVKEAGVLSTGGTKTSQVFSLEDSATGQVSGFDAAIAQTLARYIIGGDDARSLLEITQVSSATRETMLENGSVQAVVATYTINPERAEKIGFAGPYYSSEQGVLVRADDDTITGVGDLAGVKVAVQSDSTSISALKTAAPEAEQVPMTDHSTCVSALETRQVDAYVVDESLLTSEIEGNDAVKVVGDSFGKESYGIGLPKDSDAQTFVNTFLQTIEDDGTWAAIWDATIGTTIGGERPQPPVIGSVPGAETGSPSASAPSSD